MTRPLFCLAVALVAAAQAPDCAVAPGFPQLGASRDYTTENLYDYINGNSEGYFLYGFVRMKGVSCKQGAVTLVIDVSEFKDAESAYGMFMANIDARQPLTPGLGAAAQVLPRKATFVKDKYYVEISADPESDHTALLAGAMKRVDAKMPGATTLPPEIAWFPKEKQQPNSVRLVPQSLLGLRMLGRGYIGQYDNGKPFVVKEASPEAAAALLAKLKARFAATNPAQVADEAFTAQDRYWGRLCLFRKGARIGGWTSVPEGEDPAALAASLAARLP